VIFVETARSVFEKYVTNSFGKKRRKGFKNGISVFSHSLSSRFGMRNSSLSCLKRSRFDDILKPLPKNRVFQGITEREKIA